MIYFDSAATTLQKPPQVARAVENAIQDLSSPGRGAYAPAVRAADAMLTLREEVAELLGFSEPERVVMTMNATHGINLALRSTVREGDRVVISGYEHNAVTRTLHALGAEVLVVGRQLFAPEQLLSELRESLHGVAAAAFTHVSNVFGYVLPIKEIAELCRDHGVPLLLDLSQSAGALDICCAEFPFAFAAMPGHKSLLGPQGTGLLLCAHEARPMLFGGSGSDSLTQSMPDYYPERLEAGTQNACGAAGLVEGIRYLQRRGVRSIAAYERDLRAHLCEELKTLEGVEIFSGPCQSGVVSVRFRGRDCEEVAAWLAGQGICVRAGLHCAPLAHASAGTINTGTMRFSFSPLNTHEEIATVVDVLRAWL